MLEARRFLESVEASPPQPFNQGCAKLAIDSVFKSLRLTGLFHEHGKYKCEPLSYPIQERDENFGPPQTFHVSDQSQEPYSNHDTNSKSTLVDTSHTDSSEDIDGAERQQKHPLRKRAQLPLAGAILQEIDGGSGIKHKVEPQHQAEKSEQRKISTNISKRVESKATRIGTISTINTDRDAKKLMVLSKENNNDIETRKSLVKTAWADSEIILNVTKKSPAGQFNNKLDLVPGKEVQTSDMLPYNLDKPGDYLNRCGLIGIEMDSPILQSLGWHTNVNSSINLTERYAWCGQKPPKRQTFLQAVCSDRTYAFILMLIMWANFSRLIIYLIDDQGVSFFMLAMTSMWYLMVALSCTVSFVSCTMDHHLLLFFLNWRILFLDPVTRSLGLRGTTHRSYSYGLLVIKWVLIIINLITCVFLMFMEDEFSGGLNKIFYVTGSSSTATLVVSGIVLFFCVSTWLGLPVLIVSLCHLISAHFDEFNDVFKLHVMAAGNRVPKHLRLLRECHLAMCNNVSIMDRFISYATGAIFSVSIANACLILYVIVNVSTAITVAAINAFWLLSNIVMVGYLSFHLASVSDAMHSVGTSLQSIQTHNAGSELIGQLQMFLSKVNGPPMGFTVLKLITLTKELVLTLLGLYATYGLVLLQFKA